MKIKQGVVTIEPITIIAAVIALILGAVIGFCYRKQIAEAKIGVAEKRANDIVEDAKKEAEAKKKEILLEAKEESIRTRMSLKKKQETEEMSFPERRDVLFRRKKLLTARLTPTKSAKSR